MARLQFPTVDEMTPEQRNVHDEVVSGIRGRLVGPLRAVIHSPDLARRWSRLGEYLRFSTCLPKKLNELAIIVTGRRWNSQLEFLIHAEAAKAAGLDPASIEAIRVGEAPTFADEAEAEIYEFARLAAADWECRRPRTRSGDGALGRPRRRRADRRHRVLHDGFNDSECTRNSNPSRRDAAAVSAERRWPDDAPAMPIGKNA